MPIITLKNSIMISTIQSYLLEKKYIDQSLLREAIDSANLNHQSLLCYLARHQLLSADIIAETASYLFHLPITDLSDSFINKIDTSLISIKLMNEFYILPLQRNQTLIDLAMVDPGDFNAIETVKFHTGLQVNTLLVRYDQLVQAIKTLTLTKNTQSLNILKTVNQQNFNDELNTSIEGDEPLVRFINHIIEEAIERKASDIHFETYESHCRIRFRQDGILHEIEKPPYQIAKRIISRLKIMAKLDITEQRFPQDGRFKVKSKDRRTINIRLNSCPILDGEKIVLRLLDNQNICRDIYQIGLNITQQTIFLEAIHKPQGLILVTGPTGGGKTSTLYASLSHLNSTEKNISTVEDPVEINLPNINQVNVNPKIGLNFPLVLRTFLRQDPDIILIGEIRDLETAEIAFKAAQTGHLVLSTLHANNAKEALLRLHHMGIALYPMISSTNLITAQRLIRRLCPHCKEKYELPKTIHHRLNFQANTSCFKASGCKHCFNGYNGRMAIHEILTFDEKIFNSLYKENSLHSLFYTLRQQTNITLQQIALEKVVAGETSIEEVLRVINFKNEQDK